MKYCLFLISFFFCSCVNEEKKALDQLFILQRKLMQVEDAVSNRALAIEVLETYNSFLEAYPDSENNPEILYNVGQVFMGLGNNSKALDSFYLVHSKFPKSSWAPLAFFQQASCFESLNQRLTAKKTYEEFVERYPNHPYIFQANELIKLLYLTDEELINQFEN
tara:strand:- start:1716 stop:2207 length:492 start_codon:yes stop_codon:yes gene_type:complete